MPEAIASGVSAITGTQSDTKIKATPSDYETFLTMLTTQLENQDPLDPVESQDLAVQLATFSGVEQQTLTNDLLSQLAQALGAGSMSELSNWIGREVLTEKPAWFSGAPIEVEFKVPDQATAAELVVYDDNDREVQRLVVPLDSASISWAGVSRSGQPFPIGNYHFEVQGNADGAPLPPGNVRSFAEVAEVRRVDGETVLRLNGGGDIPAEDVLGFR